MSFEKGDRVVFHDEHSEYDGQAGEVTQVMETMFGDENYTVSFEGGQEAGISAEQIEAAADDGEDAANDGEDAADDGENEEE